MINYICYKMEHIMNILYEDKEIMVIDKEAGVAVQTAKIGQQDLESMARKYLSDKGEDAASAMIVHRLDQPVRGIILIAKTRNAAKVLSEQLNDGRAKKEYVACVLGCDKKTGEEIELRDYLIKDGKNSIAKVVSKGYKGAKEAVLSYMLHESGDKIIGGIFPECEGVDRCQVLKITLDTGRFHQIRCQLSNAGMPILGDVKYGGMKVEGMRNQIALCAFRLTFEHPKSGKSMTFEVEY